MIELSGGGLRHFGREARLFKDETGLLVLFHDVGMMQHPVSSPMCLLDTLLGTRML